MTDQHVQLPSTPVTISGPVTVTGTVTTVDGGYTIGGRITQVPLTATGWTPLPATPFPGRKALSIQNSDLIEIKINYDNTVPTYTGVTVASGSERFYNVSTSVIIYAKAKSGTPTIQVEEIG